MVPLVTLNSNAKRLAGSLFLKPPSVAGNWSVLTVSGLASQGLNMLAIFRIARILQPQGFGEYNLVLTVAGVAFVFGALGLRQVVIRDCARRPIIARPLLRRIILIRGVAGVVVGVGTAVYSTFLPEAPATGLQIGILLLLAGQLIWDSIESVLFGLQKMVVPALTSVLGSILWVCFIWLVPSTFLNSVSVSVSFALLQVIKGISVWRWWLAIDKGPIETVASSTMEAGELIKASAPFYWLAIMTTVGNSLPILFLALRSNQTEIGLFNAPWRLLAPFQLLLNTGMAALYPMISKQSKSDAVGFTQSVRRAGMTIVVLGSCLALWASLLRRELVSFLFGQAYLQSADILMHQCWLTLILGVYYLIGVVLSAQDKQRPLAIVSTIYAAVSIPFAWLGSVYGAAGLVVGMLACAFANFPYHWIVFQRSMPIGIPLRDSTLMLTFAVILVLPAYMIPSEGHFVLRVGVGCLAGLLTGIIVSQMKRLDPVRSQASAVAMQEGE